MLAFLSASISAMRRRVSAYLRELVPVPGVWAPVLDCCLCRPCRLCRSAGGWVAEFLVALVAGLPVALGDDGVLFRLHRLVEFLEAVDVLLGEHGHVDGLGEGAAEIGVAGVGGGGGQELEGGVEIRPAVAEGRDGGEDLGDGIAVGLRGLVALRRLAEVFLEAGLEQAVVAERDGDAADGDGFRGGIEQRDFLAERAWRRSAWRARRRCPAAAARAGWAGAAGGV